MIRVNVKSKNNFTQVQNASIQDVANALYLVAEEIMTDAKMNYVPVVTGDLRRSGFVQKPTITPNRGVEVVLGFGGSAAPYALKVHEMPASWGQGKNKYLSKPINAAAPKIASRMAFFIRKGVFGRGRP